MCKLEFNPKDIAERVVEKEWGVEYWLCNRERYCSKILEIYSGRGGSFHCHEQKMETFLVLHGRVLVYVGKYLDDALGEEDTALGSVSKIKLLRPSQSLNIYPYTFHLVQAVSRCSAMVLETGTHHDEADVIRIWRMSEP